MTTTSGTCEACGTTFTATRASAKFCSTACRQRAHRDRQAAEVEPVEDGDLVVVVRSEVAQLRRLGTPEGQLAVILARGVERRPSAGLAQQLREVLERVRHQSRMYG